MKRGSPRGKGAGPPRGAPGRGRSPASGGGARGQRSGARGRSSAPGARPPTTPIALVAFLGNPGRQYAATRHNVGWMVADHVAAGCSWKEKFHGEFCKRDDLVLLRPHTFMNESGRSVQAACAFFSVSPEAALIVHDDLETPFGTLRLDWAGGHRGQNGVRSVITHLSGPAFWRLRVGVGRPPAGRRPGDWVLERFDALEEAMLPGIMRAAAGIVDEYVSAPRVVTRVVHPA